MFAMSQPLVYRKLQPLKCCISLNRVTGSTAKGPCLSGKNSYLNPLASQKQLLLAESELNRAHLVEDVAAISTGIHALAARAKSFGSIASSVAALVAGVAAFRRGRVATAGPKPLWQRIILKVAGLASTAWLALRTQSRSHSK